MKEIIYLFFFLVAVFSRAASQNIATPYNFPIKPGSKEWRLFTSRAQKAEALQIPAGILKDLTTDALAKTCMQFPMFTDLYFFNDIQTGFNTLRHSFNGFNELLSRKDAPDVLFNIYKQMNPSDFNKVWDDTAKGRFTFQFLQIEIILAQNDIINVLSKEKSAALLKESVNKYDAKSKISLFSIFTLSPSILIMARTMEKENRLQDLKSKYPTGSIEKYLATGLTDHQEIFNQIVERARK